MDTNPFTESFDDRLKKICAFAFDVDGVLSPSTIPMGADGVPRRMANIKDGYAMQLAAKHGYKIAIITGGVSEAIKTRYNALGIPDIFMGAAMKLPVFKKWLEDNQLDASETVYVGDDIPDYECMLAAGISVAPADAASEIRNVADYISDVNGGYGVARDILEKAMKARGDWMTCEKAFGW